MMTIREKEKLQREVIKIRDCFNKEIFSIEKNAEKYRSISSFCDFFLTQLSSEESSDYESLLKYLKEEYKKLYLCQEK